MDRAKRVIVFTSVLFSAVMAAGLLSLDESAAQEFTCRMKAALDNVYVFGRDMDRDGNPTGRVIYKGWMLQGRSIRLRSFSGRISYSYKADSDYRGSGSNESVCTGDRMIDVP